ncbi:aldehyde dehydrogenase family protein [Streptomyces sp. NPDC057582]|uniref:aldehyde dehydrogenase family protein n=1 Tax=Streptomyces sp. NPDC057582 TaxID=3346174 RepID=UPI0036B6B399
MLIGGRWGPAQDGGTLEVVDPAHAEPIAEVANATVEDAVAAVDAAHTALDGRRATAPRVRGEILRRAFELMTGRAEAFAELIVRENGKALADARAEVAYAAEFFRWYAEEAVRAAGSVQTAPAGTNKIMVLRQPVGVALLITPWNFPADVDEAIRMANDTECGLVSYVYTGDLAEGLRVSEAMESGMVGLNRPVMSDPAAPFGGVKQSGVGREGGHDGLLEFTESKYIALHW